MDGFNVLRGREPIKSVTSGSTTTYYCAGYIKYLPARGRLYGIEFSGYNRAAKSGRNPAVNFDYYIFCSENAWINYMKERGITNITNKVSDANANIGNPATFVISSDKYVYDSSNPIVYPHNIGFSGSDYDNAEPRPYSNADGFINSNDVQYPLYLYVEFASNPNTGDNAIDELDYQLVTES